MFIACDDEYLLEAELSGSHGTLEGFCWNYIFNCYSHIIVQSNFQWQDKSSQNYL